MVGVIHRRLSACFLLIELRREAVVTELHWPGEMVIQLQPLHRATLQGFHHKTNEPFFDRWMGGIEPGHAMAAVHGHPPLTIRTGEHPFGVVLHKLGRRGLHQPVLKPGHHLNAALATFLHQGADRIDGDAGLSQRRLHRGIGAWVKGGATTPDIRQHTVEAGRLEFLHRSKDAGPVVIKRAGAVGEPDALGGVGLQQSIQTRLSLSRRTKPKPKGKRQYAANGTSN